MTFPISAPFVGSSRLDIPPLLLEAFTRQQEEVGLRFLAERPELTTTLRTGPRSHCLRGHALTPANVYTAPNGSRLCRACMTMRVSRRSNKIKRATEAKTSKRAR